MWGLGSEGCRNCIVDWIPERQKVTEVNWRVVNGSGDLLLLVTYDDLSMIEAGPLTLAASASNLIWTIAIETGNTRRLQDIGGYLPGDEPPGSIPRLLGSERLVLRG